MPPVQMPHDIFHPENLSCLAWKKQGKWDSWVGKNQEQGVRVGRTLLSLRSRNLVPSAAHSNGAFRCQLSIAQQHVSLRRQSLSQDLSGAHFSFFESDVSALESAAGAPSLVLGGKIFDYLPAPRINPATSTRTMI